MRGPFEGLDHSEAVYFFDQKIGARSEQRGGSQTIPRARIAGSFADEHGPRLRGHARNAPYYGVFRVLNHAEANFFDQKFTK